MEENEEEEEEEEEVEEVEEEKEMCMCVYEEGREKCMNDGLRHGTIYAVDTLTQQQANLLGMPVD